MFVEFNKAFSKEPKHIPGPVLDYYSAQLPGQLHYEEIEPGLAALSGFQKIEGLVPVITDEMKSVLGDQYTEKDISLYSYNTQSIIELKSSDPDNYVIDGHSVPVSDMIKQYGSDTSIKDGSFFVHPKPFADPFTIVISCESCSKAVHVQQKTYASIREAKFSVIDYDVLGIDYYVDMDNKSCRFYITLHEEKAKSIKELIEAVKLYNGLISGSGTFEGMHLHRDSSVSVCPKELIEFLEKVSAIEELGNYHFALNIRKDVSMKEAMEVEKLYQNLVLKKPTLDRRKVDTITIAPNGKDVDHIRENGKLGNSAFLYMVEDKYSLYGEELVLPTIVCVYKAFYTTRQNQNNLLIQFMDKDETYSVSRCFINSNELNSFLDETPNCMNDFQDYADVRLLMANE